jgi:MFS family permease
MIRTAFRVPGFTRLFAGLAMSMVGDSLMLIVLSMWVKTLTGSNAAAGLTFLWMTAPALLAPLLGYVVDRVPRRTFLVWANVLSALTMLPLLAVRGASDVWIVYVVAACYGISFVVVPAALNGLFKDMLPEAVLVDANASLSITRESLRLVGPLAGAALFAVAGGAAVAMVDAATFLAAAVAVLSLRVTEGPLDHAVAGHHWRQELGAGAVFVRRTPVLLHSTVSLGLCLLVLGFSESAVYAVADAFGRAPTFVGVISSVQGAGAVVGGLLASRLVRRLREPGTLVAGLLLLGTGLGGVALAPEVWQLFVVVAVLGSGIPIVVVAFNTLLQRRTPGPLMGRVSTFTEVLTTTPQALSIAVGALLVTVLDYRVIFAAMAGGTLVAAAYLPLMLRGHREPPPAGTEEVATGPVVAEPVASAVPPLPEQAAGLREPPGGPGAGGRSPAP